MHLNLILNHISVLFVHMESLTGALKLLFWGWTEWFGDMGLKTRRRTDKGGSDKAVLPPRRASQLN